MKKLILFFSLFFALALPAWSQTPPDSDFVWVKSLWPNVVNKVKFSPDGSYIASAAGDTVFLLNSVDGSTIRQYGSNQSVFFSLAFSPSGDTLAMGGTDSNLVLWDLRNGNIIRIIKDLAIVKGIAFSPNGKLLYYSSTLNNRYKSDSIVNLIIYNLETENKTKIYNPDGFLRFSLSPDGRYLAAGCSNQVGGGSNVKNEYSIQLWDAINYKLIKVLESVVEDYTGTIKDVQFSPDGTMIASSREYRPLNIWDVQTQSLKMQVVKDSNRSIWTSCFSRDSKNLIFGGTSGFHSKLIDVYNLDSLKLIHTYNTFQYYTPRSIDVNIDNNYIVASNSETISLLRARFDATVGYSDLMFQPKNIILSNPIQNQIHLEFYNPVNDSYKFEYVDILGQSRGIIYVNPLSIGYQQFDFSTATLGAGTYFLKMTNSKGSSSLKFMKIN